MSDSTPTQHVVLDVVNSIRDRLGRVQDVEKTSEKLFSYLLLTVSYEQRKIVEKEGVVAPHYMVLTSSKLKALEAQVETGHCSSDRYGGITD